jgi:hypothetical protein
MTTSLSNHAPSARPVDGFGEDLLDDGNPDEARLRGLSRQQLADRFDRDLTSDPANPTAPRRHPGGAPGLLSQQPGRDHGGH